MPVRRRRPSGLTLRSAPTRHQLTGSASPESSPPLIEPDRLTLVLPVPPSINHQYATVQGRRVMTAAGRSYKAEVGHLVLVALGQAPQRAALLDCLRGSALSLSITFFFASAIRRDVDGGLKIAQDAICNALGLNDNRIVEIHLYKRQDRAQPRIHMTLSACRASL